MFNFFKKKIPDYPKSKTNILLRQDNGPFTLGHLQRTAKWPDNLKDMTLAVIVISMYYKNIGFSELDFTVNTDKPQLVLKKDGYTFSIFIKHIRSSYSFPEWNETEIADNRAKAVKGSLICLAPIILIPTFEKDKNGMDIFQFDYRGFEIIK